MCGEYSVGTLFCPFLGGDSYVGSSLYILMILLLCVDSLVLGPCFVRSKAVILLLAVLCIFK